MSDKTHWWTVKWWCPACDTLFEDDTAIDEGHVLCPECRDDKTRQQVINFDELDEPETPQV